MNTNETAFVALVPKVAAALGGRVTKLDKASPWFAVLEVDGVPLFMGSRAHEGRVSFSSQLPDYKDESGNTKRLGASDVLTYEERTGKVPFGPLDISCAITREPEAIAKDIRRRLLPTLAVIHERALKLTKQWEDNANGRLRTAARLAKVPGYSTANHSARTRLYGSGGLPSVDVQSADSIRVDHFYCTPEAFEEIAKVLRKHLKE